MKNNWDKILLELSYRVSSGIPDLTNEQHLMKLWDILKEHNWNIDARVELLKNLDESKRQKRQPGTTWVTKSGHAGKRPDGSSQYGMKSKSVAQAYVAGQDVDKDTDPKDVKSTGKEEPTQVPKDGKLVSEKEIEPSPKEEKNKKLKQSDDEDYERQKNEALEKDIEPNDDDYENEKNKKPVIEQHEYDPEEIEVNGKKIKLPVTAEYLEKEIFNQKPRRFPKRYLNLLERALNSKRNGKHPKLSRLNAGLGQGINTAQISELMIGMASTLPEEERKQFFDTIQGAINSQVGANTDNQIVDTSWLEASRTSVDTTINNMKEEFNTDDIEIENFSWDIEDDVESVLGFSDYQKNKGKSTDTWFRVKVDGESKVFEATNKKSLSAILKSPSSIKIETQAIKDGKIPPPEEHRQATNLVENGTKRCKDRLSSMTKEEIETLLKMNNMSDEELLAVVKTLPANMRKMFTKGSGDNMKIDRAKADKVLKNFEKIAPFLPADLSTPEKEQEFIQKLKDAGLTSIMGDGFGGGDIRKLVTRANTLLYANEIKDGTSSAKKPFKNGPSGEFLQNHIGLLGQKPYPEGSNRDVAEEHVKFLNRNPEYLMEYIKEAFPLRDLLEGEESGVAGSNALTPEVLMEMFGTNNYDEIQEGLQVREDPETGVSYLVYTAKSGDKEVKISNITARSKDIGVAGLTTEMNFHPEFQEQVHCANKKRKGGRQPNPENYTQAEKNLDKRVDCSKFN